MGAMPKPPDPNRMVTVHSGPAWDVQLLAMQLEEAGIASFQPDTMTKAVDPFITGANPLASRLQVRLRDAEEATALVEAARESLRPAELEGDDDYDEEDDAVENGQTPEEEVESLATRTRWAALMGFTLPFALVSGWLYLRASRAYGIRSRSHGLTIAAFGLGVVALLVPLVWLVWNEVFPTVIGLLG